MHAIVNITMYLPTLLYLDVDDVDHHVALFQHILNFHMDKDHQLEVDGSYDARTHAVWEKFLNDRHVTMDPSSVNVDGWALLLQGNHS